MKLSKLVSVLGKPRDKYTLHICNCDKVEFACRSYFQFRDLIDDPDYRYWRKYKVYYFHDDHIYVWHPKIHITARQCFTVNDTSTKVFEETDNDIKENN